MSVTLANSLELSQVCRLRGLKDIHLTPCQFRDTLQYLSFRHSEDATGTVVACDQISQSDCLFGWKGTIPPIVDEESEKLLRDGRFGTGIKRVKRFPFSSRILSLPRFLNKSKNRQSAVQVVLSSTCKVVSCSSKPVDE